MSFEVKHNFGEKSAADLSKHDGFAFFSALRTAVFLYASLRINLLYSFDLFGLKEFLLCKDETKNCARQDLECRTFASKDPNNKTVFIA